MLASCTNGRQSWIRKVHPCATRKGSSTPWAYRQGSRLASASSATPVDGGVRQHQKLGKSQYIYVGRSYGIGASAGLVDDDLSKSSFATSYAYQETGYNTVVKGIYNASSEYIIMENTGDMLYKAIGWLPNSPEAQPEFSVHIGHDADPIVAIGVSKYGQGDARRLLASAAGLSYQHLNATQCTLDYVPTRFNVHSRFGLPQHHRHTRQNTAYTILRSIICGGKPDAHSPSAA